MAACSCWWEAWSFEPMTDRAAPTPATPTPTPAIMGPMDLPCSETLSRAVEMPSMAPEKGPRISGPSAPVTPLKAEAIFPAAFWAWVPTSPAALPRADRSAMKRTTTEGLSATASLPVGLGYRLGLPLHQPDHGREHLVG